LGIRKIDLHYNGARIMTDAVRNVLAVISVDDVLQKHGVNNSVDAAVMLDADCMGTFAANVSGYLAPLPPASVSSVTSAKWVLWRATSLTFNAKYHCLITGVSVEDTANCFVSQPVMQWIDRPTPLVTLVETAVQPEIRTQTETVWAAEIKGAGNVKYEMSVKVLDHHGNLQGYYRLQSTLAVN